MRNKILIFTLVTCFLIDIIMPLKVSATLVKKERFEKLSIDEGLSNEYVTTIFQDSKGYMWIGTIDGLNRYDGERIKIYNCNNQSNDSLSSTYITAIEEDSHGNIWIATDNGLDFLIRDTDEIVRMKDIENDKYNLGDLKITSLLRSSYDKDVMWVGTENGLMKFNVITREYKTFYNEKNNENSLTSSSITSLKEGKNGELWVGTKDGINVIDKDLNIIYNENEIHRDKLYIYNIEMDKEGNPWISTKEGILIFDLREIENTFVWIVNNEGIKKYSLKEKKIIETYSNIKEEECYNNNFILSDSESNIWISSSNGILKYIPNNNYPVIIKKDENFSDSLSSNVITCFYEDFNNTIWIGTDKGINILNKNNQFNFFEEQINLKDKNIVSMLQDDNYLWIATKYDGIYIYNSINGDLITRIYDNENGISLRNQHIKSLFKSNDNWIVITTNKEVISLNTKDYRCKYHFIDEGYSSELNYLYNDEENIWLSSTTNFYSYNIDTGEITYHNENLKSFNINPGRIRYILPDYKDDDIIWLGGIDTGVIKYHKKKGVIKKYNSYSLNKNYINCMNFDNLGNLWIGTNVGLIKFNLENEEFTSYTTANGLTNNFINSILVDDNNNIWLSTNKGLNKFEIENEKIINFNKIHGLYGYQFNLNSGIKFSNGMMAFGSTEGVTYFYPDDIVVYNNNVNEVVIGDIYIGKNKVIYDGKELILEYNDKNLTIDYFLPNYENINNTTYEYIREGIDSDWIYIDSKSSLDFKSLEPGKYILKLRARSSNGELTNETSINIRVKNPIWKTPLAYVIYIGIAIVIAAYIFNYVNILHKLVAQKTKKINKQLEENKRLSKEIIDKEKLKNSYFVNLSHELRTPINVISSTVQLVKALVKEKNMTYEKSAE